ncbi:MAG: MolR family transcriptional regulator, partial [Anaerolinea sp.]|nr:MolR family transcriptional regulator [Anaerolinea sp.]
QERGMTRGELEDRVVPDCGLDENGRREFSFGPRSFSFVLTGDLKPMVRDESGKLRPGLPDPGSKDDAAVAAESVEEWKLLKKQIKEVAAIQAARLEQAMVTGRRWSPEDFQTLLARHPLMTHLVQKLIWAGFDAKGKKVLTFRVTEERDLADADDNAITLDKAAQIGLAHPLELTEAERERWGEVLGDYEVISPFPQLGRPVYTLEPAEMKAKELDRVKGIKLVAPTLVFTLEKMHWSRGVGMDGGCFDEHSKQFPAAGVTAVIGYEGNVGMGWISPDELLTLTSVYFVEGMRAPSGYGGWQVGGGKDAPLPLGKVPPIVISEVLADLQVLKSKAK